MPILARFRNAALIYNPLAGRKRGKRERDLDRAAYLLDAYRISVTRFPTTGPGKATELARREVAAGRDLIIACGGDGTVNEVVNGMAGSRVPLALLPAGTGNALAKELGLDGKSIGRAAEYIPRAVVRRIALGLVHQARPEGRAAGRYYLSVAGAGADGHLLYRMKTPAKLRLGMLYFWLEGLRQLFLYDFPEFDVEADGRRFPTCTVVVSRSKNYGGPGQLTPRADLGRDDFEVCLFPRCSPCGYLLYLLALVFNVSLEVFPEFRCLRARRVRAEPRQQRIHLQADGELLGELPAEFTVVPDALSLLVPATIAERWTPSRTP
ncbi:diacylglycerol kinase family lipid kinase [Acidobacteriia bacterium AH_259_A11_L15]|nr:diacylglycerol kinase family lipid kinase [Acidobacteriia bacterium AH_259_A11_L15]